MEDSESIPDGKRSAMSVDSSGSDLVVVTAIIESMDEDEPALQLENEPLRSVPLSPAKSSAVEAVKQVDDTTSSSYIVPSPLAQENEKDINICVTPEISVEISRDRSSLPFVVEVVPEVKESREKVEESNKDNKIKSKEKVEDEVKEIVVIRNEKGEKKEIVEEIKEKLEKDELKTNEDVEERGNGAEIIKETEEKDNAATLIKETEGKINGAKMIKDTEQIDNGAKIIKQVKETNNGSNIIENVQGEEEILHTIKINENNSQENENKSNEIVEEKKENKSKRKVEEKGENENQSNKKVEDKKENENKSNEIVEEKKENGIESIESRTDVEKGPTAETIITDQHTDANDNSVSKGISRELKSLIKSAKESKIINECTQVKTKMRKSTVHLGFNSSLNVSTESEKSITDRRGSTNSQISNSSEKSIKRSMRSQNPEFVTKQKLFLNSVTGKLVKDNWDSVSEADSIDENNLTVPESIIEENTVSKMKPPTPVPKTKLSKSFKRRPGSDSFCWYCHWSVEPASKDKSPGYCTVCPKSYHFKCLNAAEKTRLSSQEKKWVCPDCMVLLHVENSVNRSPAMRKVTLGTLSELLSFAWNRITQTNGVEPFMSPVDRAEFPDYDKCVIHPMDLNKIKENIDNSCYGSTEAFHTDVQWILHNSIIFNSVHSKLTVAAKALVRACRTEMAEIETCPECYGGAHTHKLTWFIDVCSNPHILLWAKLKGFPYWPAKGMSLNNAGQVDVRFFGAHDRARVPARDCYLYSVNDPNNFRNKRQDILDSMKEAEEHVRNIARKFGKYVHAEFQTKFDPANWNKQLQKMIPDCEIDLSYNRLCDKSSFSKIKKSASQEYKDEGSDDDSRPLLKRKMADGKEINSDSFEKNTRIRPASVMEKNHKMDEPEIPSRNSRTRPASLMEKNDKTEPETPSKRRRVSVFQETSSHTSKLPKRRERAMSLHSEEPDKNTDSEKLNKTMDPKDADAKIFIRSARKRPAPKTEKSESPKPKNRNSNINDTPKQYTNNSLREKTSKENVNEDNSGKGNEPISKVVINKGIIKILPPKTRSREGTPTTKTKKSDINETEQMPILILPANEKPKRFTTSTPKSTAKDKKKEREKSKEESGKDKIESSKGMKESEKAKDELSKGKSELDKHKRESDKRKGEPDKNSDEPVKGKEDAVKGKDETNQPRVKPIKLIRNSNNRKSLSIKRDSDTESIGKESTENVEKAKKSKSSNTIKENGNKSLPIISNIVATASKASIVPAKQKSVKKSRARQTHTVIPIPGFPTITNIRSLNSIEREECPKVTLPPQLATPEMSKDITQVVIPQNASTEKTKDKPVTKSTTEKANAPNPMVGRVGVRSFARIPPPVEKQPTVLDASKCVEVEIKGEPLDMEESRHSEKMELMNTVNLRPVTTATNKLREVRLNKTVVSSVPETKEVPARARKSFPQGKKADDGSLYNNGMVYIPIPQLQKPGPKSKSAKLPRLSVPVSIAPAPTPPPTHMTSIIAPKVLASTIANAFTVAPPVTVTAPTTVRAMPMLTAVNGQWTLALQPVMSVGSTETTPIVNGVPPVSPEVTVIDDEDIVPDQSTFTTQNPLDNATPLQSALPTPSSAGPLTSKLNHSAVKLTDFFRSLLVDCIEKVDVPASVLTQHKLQLEQLRWKHQQELQELKHNHNLMLAEVRTSVDTRLTTDLKRTHQLEMDAAEAQIKTKQWCANCRQEAKLLCCWNTSYCDELCQRAHWSQHRPLCRPLHTDMEHRVNPLEHLHGTSVSQVPSKAVSSNSKGNNKIIVNDRVRCIPPYLPAKTQSSIVLKNPVRLDDGRPVVTSGGYLIVGGSAAPTNPTMTLK